MPRKPKAPNEGKSLADVTDYRHDEATRKNNPPAKIAAEGFVPLLPKAEYQYSPRRPPELRLAIQENGAIHGHARGGTLLS